ncbi:MAG: single-stranded-DNA-specific exonuclease RecJ [Gaiella sp.]|nr:single-stranded-DNA-specific exonuclease RecJ [Gaiella sp.]
MQDGRWITRPCDWSGVQALAEALDVSDTLATVLVRRGLRDPADASAFLAAEPPGHDPSTLGDITVAVERIRAAVAARERICVHGDYDVDGISATAVAVLVLRELGANVEFRLPSRFEEGYGLAAGTIEQLAADGVDLVLTVDCGITAVDEVARARELGVDVIVTDHHRPGETLPDCPIVATRPSAYPFPELCGAGVVHTLARALLGDDHPAVARVLDLVALATIADVVPLVDENRALAAAGLRVLARTGRPGLQELMRVARVDPAAVDATAVAFRLAPRINAAGRLGRPDVALELLLTEDRARARELAATLEELNRERQGVEERILREAVAAVESWPAETRARRGYVLWNEGWHEGVIGIVASRLVERFHRPVVLVARSGEGWKGSGRSISDFDLHGGLAACAEHLARFGGHRAAAGLTVATEQLQPFADAFGRYADTALADADLRPLTTVDAIVSRRCADSRPRAGARPARAVRAGKPRADPSRRERGGNGGEHRGGGEAPTLPRPAAGARRRLRDRLRSRAAARPAPALRPHRRRVPPQGEPLERHRGAAARRPARVRRSGRVRRASRVARRRVARR